MTYVLIILAQVYGQAIPSASLADCEAAATKARIAPYTVNAFCMAQTAERIEIPAYTTRPAAAHRPKHRRARRHFASE